MARKTNTKKPKRTMDDLLADENNNGQAVKEEETEDSVKLTREMQELDAGLVLTDEGRPDVLAELTVEQKAELQAPVEPPPPQVHYFDYETAMKRVDKQGIKVCRSIWDPMCFLVDPHRRVNGSGATLPWNPGRADRSATDWMDFAVRTQGTV